VCARQYEVVYGVLFYMDWCVKDENGIGVWFMEKGLVIL